LFFKFFAKLKKPQQSVLPDTAASKLLLIKNQISLLSIF